MGVLLDVAEAMTRRQRQEIAERVAKDQNLGVIQVSSALSSLAFLLMRLTDEQVSGDSVEDLAADFAESAKTCGVAVPDDAETVFTDVVDRIRNVVASEYEKVKDRKATAAGVLPSIKSFGTTVEFRAVVENEFRIGLSADEYEPNVKGLVPVISVAIDVDEGPVKSFCFQASEDELKALIEELRSAFVCLRDAKRLTGIE